MSLRWRRHESGRYTTAWLDTDQALFRFFLEEIKRRTWQVRVRRNGEMSVTKNFSSKMAAQLWVNEYIEESKLMEAHG